MTSQMGPPVKCIAQDNHKQVNGKPTADQPAREYKTEHPSIWNGER